MGQSRRTSSVSFESTSALNHALPCEKNSTRSSADGLSDGFSDSIVLKSSCTAPETRGKGYLSKSMPRLRYT